MLHRMITSLANLKWLALLAVVYCGSALVGCGGDSDDGDLIIDGTLLAPSARSFSFEAKEGPGGYTISALGSTDVTGAEGNFQLFADSSNIPALTLITIGFPNGSESPLIVDTSGTPPFALLITIDENGTVSSELAPGNSPPPIAPPSGTISATPEPTPPSAPTSAPTFAPTIAPTADGEFDENSDCFCDDGFGPVAPSFTCADTRNHPTNCSAPSPTPAA